MLFSTNSPEFGSFYPALVKFVLNKRSRYFPSQFDVYMALFRGPYARSSGITPSINTHNRELRMTSEIAYPPFALLLTVDTSEKYPGRVSHFGHDEEEEARIVVLAGEGHTPYPGDYRTLLQVLRDATPDRQSGQH